MTPRSSQRAAGFVALGVAVLAVFAAPAGADDQTPAQWPAAPDASPTMQASAHSIRLSGPDRYQTNLALELALRGKGDYPFATPDRAAGWFGAGQCPGSVIVVAGDTTADALAATPLSDPTDLSSEPRLQRTSSSNPTLHPVGTFTRVDTARAPIIATPSARQGATSLSLSATTAARDAVEAKDGCLGATSAIVVGGSLAVPPGADDQLLSLGYDDVFRVSGPDRYATAAAIATSLGTATVSLAQPCADGDTSDGSAHTKFYANSVVEYRADPTTCELLSRTVVLADGVTGADALAAGWFTSFFQVPVLLTGPGGSLPQPTVDALTSMNIDNLVVLGGSDRIPNTTVSSAAADASATTFRVAGADRYATSVRIAEFFGGWWPTGHAADAAGSMVCLVASAGSGATAVGAADALGAGPLCGALATPATARTTPVRALPPTNGAAPAVTTGARAKDLVPIVLTAPSQQTVSTPVQAFLGNVFDPGGVWCSSAAPPPLTGCSDPGFVLTIGGTGVVSDATMLDAARLVAGGTYAADDLTPSSGAGWWTRLDMSPVFFAQAGASDNFCFPRDGLAGVRWLGAWADPARVTLRAVNDVMLAGAYVHDADGGARGPGASAPACVGWSGGPSTTVAGVSLSGHVTQVQTADTDPNGTMTMSGPIAQAGGTLVSGEPTTNAGEGTSSRVTFTGPFATQTVTSRNESAPTSAATLDLTFTRGVGDAPTTFNGQLTITTSSGTVTATVSGEGIFDGRVWRFRGRTALLSGWNTSSGVGGFAVDLDTGTSSDSGDDSVSWQLDALAQ